MSAVLALFDTGGTRTERSTAVRLLREMGARGGDVSAVRSAGRAMLGVSRFAWETAPGFSGGGMVVEDDDVAVVADASLYYRDELRRRLASAGVSATGETPGHLVIAAYRAWGVECGERLEGDFAFVLADRDRRRLVVSRDASGARPLFWAKAGGTVVVASAIGAITAHPDVTPEYDLERVALDAAGIMFASTEATCFKGIRAVHAGSTLVVGVDGEVAERRWWTPADVASDRATRGEQAAEELREILGRAVEERVQPGADPTTLWLSGGWDSLAVFVAGRERLGPRAEMLRTLSVSYPEGDTGREDETIEAALAPVGIVPRFVDIGEIDPVEVSIDGARSRDEPYAFPFVEWQRSMAAATARSGGRTVLTGHGGNFLFESSPLYLADLVARGRLLTAAREWRTYGVRHARAKQAFKWMVNPLLPDLSMRLVERITGKHVHRMFERPVPRWLRPDFVERHGIRELAREAAPPRQWGRQSETELAWFVTHPAFPRVVARAFEATLSGGVEVRSPLLDPRVIRFAAAGDWSERRSGGSSKWLLRRMMKGRVPDSTLAPRPVRTGTLESYYERSIQERLMPVLRDLFADPVLARMGIVDRAALGTEFDLFRRGVRKPYARDQLMSLARAESWFRARAGNETTVVSPDFDGARGLELPIRP